MTKPQAAMLLRAIRTARHLREGKPVESATLYGCRLALLRELRVDHDHPDYNPEGLINVLSDIDSALENTA